MTWFTWALLSGAFYTILGLLSRQILKNNHDSWSFSFFFSLIGALVCLPFALWQPQITTYWFPWAVLVFISLLIVLHNFLSFYSAELLPASISGTLTKFRLVWTLLFGVAWLNEGFTWQKVLGTVLTILAGVIVVFHYQKLKTTQGIWLSAVATIIYALVSVFFKYLFNYFNVGTMTFFIFFIPAILNYLLIPRSWSRITQFAKVNGYHILWVGLLAGLANLTANAALASGEISRVGVIIETFLIATLVGEHFFLKEREHLFVKMMAVVLALAGAVLIKMGS